MRNGRLALQKLDELIELLVKGGMARSSFEIVSAELIRRNLIESVYGPASAS